MNFGDRWEPVEHGQSDTWTVYAITPGGRDVVAVGFTREDAEFVCAAHTFVSTVMEAR